MADFEFSVSDSFLGTIITILVASTFIYFAARIVADRSSFGSAILTAVIGTILANVAWALSDRLFGEPLIGLIFAVLTWGLIAAVFYRTQWLKGALIGIVAWILWFVVTALITFFSG